MNEKHRRDYQSGADYGERLAVYAKDLASKPEVTRLDLQRELLAIVYGAIAFHVAETFYVERFAIETCRAACHGLSDQMQLEFARGVKNQRKVAAVVCNRIVLYRECNAMCLQTQSAQPLVYFVTGCTSSIRDDIKYEDFFPLSMLKEASELGLLGVEGRNAVASRMADPKTVDVDWDHDLEMKVIAVRVAIKTAIRADMEAIYGKRSY